VSAPLPLVSTQPPSLSDYMFIVIIAVHDTTVYCGPYGDECPYGMVCLAGTCIPPPVTVSLLSSVPPYTHSDIQIQATNYSTRQ
jgi:hypothetical protein